MPRDLDAMLAAAQQRQEAAELRAARAARATADYWGEPDPHGSYCCQATCLKHGREVYVNLQDWAWVHADGWECDGLADLTAAMQAAHSESKRRKDAGMRDLTTEERNAVNTLKRLARRWPDTIMLVSMDGGLQVVDKSAYRAHSVDDKASGAVRQGACVLADIEGIPNDGGGW